MNAIENVSLRPYNTFGVEAIGRYWVEIRVLDDLITALAKFPKQEKIILGGGSNVLFAHPDQYYEAAFLKMNLLGKQIVAQDEDFVWLQVGAGENWDSLVAFCVQQGWYGVENLSLIYGTVGAAPMQNIGAYGVEIARIFEHLEAVEISTGRLRRFSAQECQFGYRESFFKREGKGKYVICSVTLRLSKKPQFDLSYEPVRQAFVGTEPTLASMRQAVVSIRQSKLPDPAQYGNGGSFFKNPQIDHSTYQSLQAAFPNLVSYPTETGRKVAAGWLIEQAGWKGKRIGNVGTYPHQALVIVNWGGAKGSEIWDFAQEVQQAVVEKFGIQLEPEVNILQ
jgi:UDP-N-acetylmuramate dehydrogenase